MRFENLSFDISGIREVYIENEHFVRCEESNHKYFKREKDSYLIPEDKFMKKLERMQDSFEIINYKAPLYDIFYKKKNTQQTGSYFKWRFWFSGETLNIKRTKPE